MQYLCPYLIFNGNCRQAMSFYEKCLGGVLYQSFYGDAPGANVPPEKAKWIIHARLTIKNLVLMASDTHGEEIRPGNNFFVSLNCESQEEIERIYKSLSEKASSVELPLQETFFAVRFGMFTDQFGIKWMLNLEKP